MKMNRVQESIKKGGGNLKPTARESFIKALTKACEKEDVEINFEVLSDKELKELYVKLQAVQRGILSYAIDKEKDFVTAMKNNDLQLVSFKDTYKYGVRRLTFKEFLLLCEFKEEHPDIYPYLQNWRKF